MCDRFRELLREPCNGGDLHSVRFVAYAGDEACAVDVRLIDFQVVAAGSGGTNAPPRRFGTAHSVGWAALAAVRLAVWLLGRTRQMTRAVTAREAR